MTRARQRALIFALIATGLILAGLFGLRSLNAYREFRVHRPPPAFSADSQTVETDVGLIRDWMTIPFIAKMYRVPPPVLYKALGIPSQGNRDKSLTQLNEEYFPKVPGFVETTIKAILLVNIEIPMPTLAPSPVP
ncbi:MAG: hypothetical protein ABI621_17850 [Chloroflexota bacterium]